MPIHVKDADPIPPEAVIHTGLYDLQCFAQSLFRWDERVHPDDDFLLREAAVHQGLNSLKLLIWRRNTRFQDAPTIAGQSGMDNELFLMVQHCVKETVCNLFCDDDRTIHCVHLLDPAQVNTGITGFRDTYPILCHFFLSPFWVSLDQLKICVTASTAG